VITRRSLLRSIGPVMLRGMRRISAVTGFAALAVVGSLSLVAAQTPTSDFSLAAGRLDNRVTALEVAVADLDARLAALEAPITTTTLAATTTTAVTTTTTTTTVPTTTTTVAPTTTTIPAGAVTVKPGDDLWALSTYSPEGTVFLLQPGVYRVEVEPRSRQQFIAAGPGVVLDGGNGSFPIYAFNGNTHDARGVVLRGLEITGYPTQIQLGAVLAPGGWIIEDTEIHHNRHGGVNLGPGSVIRRSSIHHNGQIGVKAEGDGVVVEDNEIAYNNHLGAFDPNFEAGGSKFINTTNLILRRNYVHHNGGPGLWADGNAYLTTYEENVIEDNTGPGIFHEISYDAVIRNNRIDRNGFGFIGGGMVIANSSNVEVYGNILVGNNGGIRAGDDSRGSGPRGAWVTKNLWVHDNDVSWGQGINGLLDNTGTGLVYQANNRFDRNANHVGADPNPFYWAHGERSWAEWQGYGADPSGTID